MSRVRVLLNSPINRTRSPSPRPTWLLRLLRPRHPSFASPRCTLPPPPPPHHGREQLPPVVVVVLLFFTTVRVVSSCAPLRFSFISRLQVARNSLQPPPRLLCLLFLLFFLPERPSVHPSRPSSKVRKYRLVCPMTRRLLLRSSLISFFLSERIFFSHLLSFFAARASFSLSLSFFCGRSILFLQRHSTGSIPRV